MMFRFRNPLMGALLAALFATGACDEGDAGPVVPPTPTGLTVTTLSPTGVRVAYGTVTGATGYVIQRAEGTGAFATVTTTTATSHDDTGLTANTTYRYRVAAQVGANRSDFTAEASITTGSLTGTLEITADITSDRTFRKDTTYVLKGFIHVQPGATLTIEAGTRIVGDYETVGSSLFVMRGARIRAMGTAADPIVFTSERAPGQRQPGDWGGLILVGNASINRGQTALEGTGGGTGSAENYTVNYGGVASPNDADDSGELRYVRVEYAGYAPSLNNELN